MRLFESDANPEAYADKLWHSLLPARPIEGCPGTWEVKGPPGERGRFSHFGVDPGPAAALIAIGDEVSIDLSPSVRVRVKVAFLSEFGIWFKDPTRGGRVRHLGWPMVDLTIPPMEDR